MTTLIAVYNSDGCVGRCDAKCYLASEPDCECICGGVNHGAGLQRARNQTAELARDWVKEYAARRGLSEYEARVQAELFPE